MTDNVTFAGLKAIMRHAQDVCFDCLPDCPACYVERLEKRVEELRERFVERGDPITGDDVTALLGPVPEGKEAKQVSISYGVIVGRFQVNNLHPGHLELFHQVSEKHDRVIVFIGIPRTIPTKRNPLDFETRKKMIQADFPDFVILPLRDEKSDKYWSERLDDSIASVTQHTENVVLYGGQNSFGSKYYGVHKVVELEINSPITGTEIREKLSNRVMQSSDFRSGVIYAASNRFPVVLSTVDMAVFHDMGDGTQSLLLARKPGELYYRFVGGFVEKGETLEAAARREVYEETNLSVSSIRYLSSHFINDWRYAQDSDTGILTSLFTCWSPTLGGKPQDDIAEIRWFSYDELPPVVEAAHMELYTNVKNWWKNRITAQG